MKPCELYILIRDSEYNCDGIDVNWKIIVDDSERIIRLIFQASATKTDTLINLQFLPKALKRNNITWYGSKGWMKAYNSCNEKIMDALKQTMIKYPSYQIESAGHSLGGVMALYSAEDIYNRFHIKASVITFGCPKGVFGSKSKKYLYSCFSSTEQYRNINDLVTYLPPFIGYKNINENLLDIKFNLFELKNVESNHHIYGIEKYYKEG